MTAEPFNLIGVDVRRRQLDRRRQVENGSALRRGLPHRRHGVADLNGEVELGSGEAFRRVLERPLGARLARRAIAYQRGRPDSDSDDSGSIEAKHDAALSGRGRVVEMYDGARHSAEALERAQDEIGARLREHLHRDVLGNEALLDQLPHEIEIGLRGGGEPDLDLLEADAHELLEQPPLARRVHRLDQRLVAVAQIDAAPRGRCRDGARRPGAVRYGDGGKRSILVARYTVHGGLRPALSELGVAGGLKPSASAAQPQRCRFSGEERVTVLLAPTGSA